MLYIFKKKVNHRRLMRLILFFSLPWPVLLHTWAPFIITMFKTQIFIWMLNRCIRILVQLSVKLFLCTPWRNMRNLGIAPRNFNPSITYRDWSALRFSRFIPWQRDPGPYRTGSWSGPGTCLVLWSSERSPFLSRDQPRFSISQP